MAEAKRSTKPLPSNAGTLPLVRRLLGEHAREHLGAYLGALVLMLIGAAATGLSVSMLRPILNGIMTADSFKTLRWLAIITAALYSLRGLATYGQQVLLSRTGNSIVAKVQTQIYDHLLRQNVGFYSNRHSSEFVGRLVIASNGVRDTLQVVFTSLGRDLLTLIALVVVMIFSDPMMTILAISVVPIGTLLLGRLIRRIRKFARRTFDSSTQIMATMQETVAGIRIIKSFNLEGIMRRRMSDSVRDVQKAANRMAASIAISSPLSDTLGGLSVAAAVLYGSWRVTVANADPGSFFAFVAALLMAYDPAKRVARLNLDIQNGLVGARLIYEILDTPAHETEIKGRPPLVIEHGRIAFEAVDFGYRPREPVLCRLDLVAEPSRTTALVGPSGGGKSTIINLIQRFYDPAGGTIRIDGRDIASVDLVSLRSQIAFVSQDVFLFRGTIRDNIALGRSGASEEQIVAAARKAHAHEFIIGFDAGYDTNVGEHGTQLSGGQRQRVAIARAILKDAPIILLDEPTAALDSESERAVQGALDDLRIGRTTLVVAHRLQTIIDADLIYVIERGGAVEHGTHDQLIARGGAYMAFFAAQFGANTRSIAKIAAPPAPADLTEPVAVAAAR